MKNLFFLSPLTVLSVSVFSWICYFQISCCWIRCMIASQILLVLLFQFSGFLASLPLLLLFAFKLFFLLMLSTFSVFVSLLLSSVFVVSNCAFTISSISLYIFKLFIPLWINPLSFLNHPCCHPYVIYLLLHHDTLASCWM